MTRQEFIDIAKRIATDIPTKYQLGGWGQQKNGYYLFDCVCLIKSILWGFDFEKGGHGGAVHCANGVPDLGANAFFDQCCYDKGTDMSNTQAGELVWMDGHIGIYIGNLQVVEATSAWDKKVLISHMDYDGTRSYNYSNVYRWTHHGKCQFIDYSSKPTYKYSVGDKIVLNGYVHTSNEKDSECIGGYIENYIGKIADIKDGEYPYYIENLGWCREKYLTLYTGEDYEELYKKELLINKDFQKQIEVLQDKINKAIDDLK